MGLDSIQVYYCHQLMTKQVNQQLFTLMEATESNILQLPKRSYGQPVKFPSHSDKVCITNYYEVDFGNKMSSIYQFCFECQPPIPQDSKDLLQEVIRSIKKQLKEKIDIVTYSGNMLWGLKQLPIPLNVKSQFMVDNILHKFDVMIKPTKALSVGDLKNSPDGQKMIHQIYNNRIKQVLREKDMDQLTRGKYFDKKEIQVKQIGLNVIRGFKFTLCTLKSGLYLQIDACSRVFRSNNLLEELSSKKSKDYADSLIGATILTTYGKRRTYKIGRICHDMNPLSKFYHQKRQGQITFAQYYLENYGLKVQAKNQPLIEVILREEKKIDKEKGTVIKKEIKGFLIPELVSLTGMSDEQRADYNTMKELAPYTKLEPEERVRDTDKIVDVFNKSGKLKIGAPKRIAAYQLFQPYIRIYNNQVVKNHGDGSMVVRDRLKHGINIKDWVIVYSQGKNSKYDDQDADAFAQIIDKASGAFGIKFEEPAFITCDQACASWKSELQADISKNGKPQIIVLYFNPPEEKFYGELKRFITCDLKMACQAVRRRTIVKAKNPMSAASKIIMQINQKVGGTAWEMIPQQGAYTSKKKTMYGGIAISKGKKGFTLAFAGTVDNAFTKVFTYCKTGYKSKEAIPQADFEAIFVNWAKNYVKLNQEGPQLIIVFRQGLSIQQIQRQVKSQIDALYNVVKKIGEKTSNIKYSPEVIYTTVNTKINTRIFDFPEGTSASSSNKFTPKAINPNSGTVVLDELSVNELYDFHLAAQKVTQGTCTPTHYIVAHNASKMSQESLSQFTYEQCFNYYNWTGAVKIPAALQCANKVAKLVGESIQTDVTSGEVLNTYYFL